REMARLAQPGRKARRIPCPEESVFLDLLRTTDLLSRRLAQVLNSEDLSATQYNVLRILRGAGSEGLPTLVIRDRMIHAAPGITRLLDKLEKAGLARRERTSSDRRQVFCYITDKGLKVLEQLDVDMRLADETAAGSLSDSEQRQLLKLLEGVRATQRRGDTPIDSSLMDDGPPGSPTD
ncbi:MAG: MarR family winged helix-turn-helix transcriptional regulator, partial [Deltaproteobacteria bacterium]